LVYEFLGLPLPTEPTKEPFDIFIYGGSTAMGISMIQMAKLSGLNVITTSSPANVEYLKSLGADHVLDYKSATILDDVLRLTNNQLEYALDAHADEASAALVAKALKGDQPRMASLLPTQETVKAANSKIVYKLVLGYSAIGRPYVSGGEHPAKDSDYQWFRKFAPMFWGLLGDGKMKAPNVYLNRGGAGLEGVLAGIDELRHSRVRAGKLVYTLD
jgi:NADPH:quinone reductase-like Zn-dependent oxidoreductase